jgi:hypothetical protein
MSLLGLSGKMIWGAWLDGEAWSSISGMRQGTPLGFPRPEVGEVGRQRISWSIQVFYQCEQTASGLGTWLPGYQSSMLCLGQHQRSRLIMSISLHKPHPQKRFLQRTPFWWSLPSHNSMGTSVHSYINTYYPTHCPLAGLGASSASTSRNWPSPSLPFLWSWTSHFALQPH